MPTLVVFQLYCGMIKFYKCISTTGSLEIKHICIIQH